MTSTMSESVQGAPVDLIGGHYRVVRTLGKGGMGTVYEAENTWTKRHVAVKVMRPEVAPAAPPVVQSAPPPPAPQPTPMLAPIAAPARPVDVVFHAPGRAPSESTGRLQRSLGWVAAGGALLAIGGGVWALAARESALRDHNNPALACTMNDRRTVCFEPLDTAEGLQTLAIAGFVGGGALAVTSLVLFLTAPSGSRPRASAGLGCERGPGTVGLSCSLVF